ncbi:MAG: PTS lactose/cellobiose transporter subunit IIA [Erysipelotrichaceae bacterium]
MEDMELICFKIISAVGEAKSTYIEAIEKAKVKEFKVAKELIAQGEEMFLKGHLAHASLIQQEASGNKTPIDLLLLHSEDQLMSAEVVKLLAVELITLYEKIN